MKYIKLIKKSNLHKTIETGACGECQTSCQSACKTSMTVGNQVCLQTKIKQYGDPARVFFLQED